MDYFGKLNAKNTYGMFDKSYDSKNLINIICGIVLILLVIILLICLFKRDYFSNNKNNKSEDNDVIVMIGNKNCGFAKKMQKSLEENNMKIGNKRVVIKDIMTDGAKLAKDNGITGTPGFIHVKSNT